VRGQRTGRKIAIGDQTKVYVANVDVPRRELNLAIAELRGRAGGESTVIKPGKGKSAKHGKRPPAAKGNGRGGSSRGGSPRGGSPRGGSRKQTGPPAAGPRQVKRGKGRGRG